MTTPDERAWAVENTRKFLVDLLDSKATPRVPKAIRLRSRQLLKHYPMIVDIKEMLEQAQHKLNTMYAKQDAMDRLAELDEELGL